LDRFLTTPDGIPLFVHEIGEGRPIVVLHGGPAAGHEYLLPAFAKLPGRIVLYDQRGCGRSLVPPGTALDFEANLRDVGTVLEDVGATDLVGYSFGGLFAMVYAARNPGRIRRLALASSAPPHHAFRAGLDAALAASQSSPWVAAERAALERSGLRESLPEEYRRRRFSLTVAGYFADPRLCYGLVPFKVQSRTADAIKESVGDYDFRDEVAGLDGSRTLFLHGEADPIDWRLLRQTADACGATFELLTASGHVPYLEAAEPFFSILRAFLGDAP
jgi:pimeloyl-ACP methyl ester carboxylesterase